MRKLIYLALLAGLSLFAACTCISAKVSNKTNEPIFVSAAYHDDGSGLTEDFGDLVLPGKGTSIPGYGNYAVRARDMRGNTVFYSPVPDNRDSSFDVSSLQPVLSAPPLGSPSSGHLGSNTRWSLVTCRDGAEVKIPLFGLLATVKNESAKGLVVDIDQYPGGTIYDWKYGVFAAPGQMVQVYEMVTEKPYLHAFDQEGQLVYMEPLTRTERPTAVIPRELPLDAPPRPEAPYDGGCRGISGILNGHFDGGDAVLLGVLAIALGTFAAFGIGALVAVFIIIRFFWDFYMRRRPG